MRLSQDDRVNLGVTMRRAYDSGASIRAIAEEHERSYAATRTYLLAAGTVLRGRGGNSRRKRT